MNTTTSPQERCIVIGNDHYNTLNVLRALARADIKPILILVSDKSRNFTTMSRCVDRYYRVAAEEDVTPVLNQIATSSHGTTLPVIYTYDAVASTVDHRLNNIASGLRMPSVSNRQGALAETMNKDKQLSLARQVGFMIPHSSILADTDPNQMPMPCIVKPQASTVAAKSSFRICQDSEQLTEIAAQGEFDAHHTLVQEFIPNTEMYEVIGVRTPDGKTHIGGTLKKIKFGYKTHNMGLNVLSSIISEPRLEKLCSDYAEKADIYGIFAIEVVVPEITDTEHRRYYFLEINLRTDAAMFVYTAAGINYAAVWANPERAREFIHNPNPKTVGMNEFHYLRHFCSLRNFPSVLADLKRTTVFSTFSLHDPKPFFGRLFC